MFEIKDLTYNAQFNFCLLVPRLAPGRFDRSESIRAATLKLRDAFQRFKNQIFKDQCLLTFGDTKTQFRVWQKGIHCFLTRRLCCQDEIEFNLKSLKS